jgi:ABC-2 type transport system permease protein
MKVVVPPAPLAALAQGEAELRPLAYRVSLFGPELVPVVEPSANPLAVTVGRFDLALATVWLLPVLVIALCYGLSAADRDAGILPLVLSQPLSPRALLAARLAIPILWVVAAVGVVAVVTAAVVRPEGSSWSGRLAAWLATSLAYGLLWVALGAAVDGRGRPAAWNALVLAGAWLLSTWVLPAAMQTVAAAAHPVPSRAVWAEDLRVFQDAREKGQDALTAQAKEALVNQLRRQEPSLAATRPAADTLGYYYFTRAAHEVAQEPQRRRLDDRMAAPLRRQEALVSALRFLSPSALALGALTDAAGAGRGRYEHFLAEAGRYDTRYKAFLWPRTFGNALIASREFDLIPRFAMSEEPFRAAWGRVRAPLAALVSLSVALFTFAFAAGVTARGRPRVLTGERPALRRARGTLRA